MFAPGRNVMPQRRQAVRSRPVRPTRSRNSLAERSAFHDDKLEPISRPISTMRLRCSRVSGRAGAGSLSGAIIASIARFVETEWRRADIEISGRDIPRRRLEPRLSRYFCETYSSKILLGYDRQSGSRDPLPRGWNGWIPTAMGPRERSKGRSRNRGAEGKKSSRVVRSTSGRPRR